MTVPIDPHRALGDGSLFSANFHEVRPLLKQALRRADVADNSEQQEIGVTAQGITKAGELLSGKYHLVVTNVPYLKRGKQDENLRKFCERHFPKAKHDLATVFLERCLDYCVEGGTTSIVLPQNWLFQAFYKNFREKLLKNEPWHMVARLGSGAFATISGQIVQAALISISHGQRGREKDLKSNLLVGIDVASSREPANKAAFLRTDVIKMAKQSGQLGNPDARVILFSSTVDKKLSDYADCFAGVLNGDSPKFRKFFWEIYDPTKLWAYQQTTVSDNILYGGLI